MDCIFCKIVSGDIPSARLHETDNFIVIKDVSPQAPLHLLVIPKKHYDNILDCNESGMMDEMMEAAKAVTKTLGVQQSGFRLIVNTNKDGGQTVFHLHMHILGGKKLSEKMGL